MTTSGRALELREALKVEAVPLVYFDLVLNETISVLARRGHEQRRADQFPVLLNVLETQVPESVIVWLSKDMNRLYHQVLQTVRFYGGTLNFHDALLALGCQEMGVQVLASFDRDFDQIPWLARIDDPVTLATTLK